MAGPWLYCISARAKRNFGLKDGPIPTNLENFRLLVENGRIVEDVLWQVSKKGDEVRQGDKLFIYTGDDDTGVIGYALVSKVKKLAKGWGLYPTFDLDKSRSLVRTPIPASVVRAWNPPLYFGNVIDISAVISDLYSHLPWASGQPDSTANECFAEAEDIEGTKTEATCFTTKRSRRLRNLAYKSAKGVCCVCERDFSKVLGGRGLRVLQVHHRQQLSARDCPSFTKLSDLAVVCANCHLLLHYVPAKAMSIEELKLMFRESDN